MRITYVVNHVAFFVSHRLPIALAAQRAGFEVNLLTGQPGSVSMEQSAVDTLITAQVTHQRVAFGSSSINPVIEAWGLVQLIGCILLNKPDLVHCASPKGLLYGGIAARLCGVKALVLAVSGMGFAFTESKQGGVLRKWIAKIYQLMIAIPLRHKNLQVIVQNKDDYSALMNSGLISTHQLTLIPGSGVDLAAFLPAVIKDKLPMVVLPARMLLDKGVIEFVEAVKLVKLEFPYWRFILAGAADYQNPSAVSVEQLSDWQHQGIIEWLGHVEDMLPYFKQASIVCLPSYREGMPKVLLEAAAAGCAVITTDTIGCRDAIIAGETGDLIPLKDSGALVNALRLLIRDVKRRESYGCAGRKLAIEKFGLDVVIEQTLKIYQDLLS